MTEFTPAVDEYPTRTPSDVRGRKGQRPSGRWAVIKLIHEGDGFSGETSRYEVIHIAEMIPADRPPTVPGLDEASEDVQSTYFLKRVAKDVKVGMVYQGTTDPVGEWGYPPTSANPGYPIGLLLALSRAY